MAIVFSGFSPWSFASVAFGSEAVHQGRVCNEGRYSDNAGWKAETRRVGLPVI